MKKKKNIVQIDISDGDDGSDEIWETTLTQTQLRECIKIMQKLHNIMEMGKFYDSDGSRSHNNPFYKQWWESADRSDDEFDDGFTLATARKFWDKYAFAFDGPFGESDLPMVFELAKKIDPEVRWIEPDYSVDI